MSYVLGAAAGLSCEWLCEDVEASAFFASFLSFFSPFLSFLIAASAMSCSKAI